MILYSVVAVVVVGFFSGKGGNCTSTLPTQTPLPLSKIAEDHVQDRSGAFLLRSKINTTSPSTSIFFEAQKN